MHFLQTVNTWALSVTLLRLAAPEAIQALGALINPLEIPVSFC